MAHDRLVTAMNPTWECRLRLSKQQGWEVRGIRPFPTGPAALTLQGELQERSSSHSFYQIQGAPEILLRKDLSQGPSILLVRPRTPTSSQPIQASDRIHLQAPGPEGILRKT